jgi:uncharacterized protein YbcI
MQQPCDHPGSGSSSPIEGSPPAPRTGVAPCSYLLAPPRHACRNRDDFTTRPAGPQRRSRGATIVAYDVRWVGLSLLLPPGCWIPGAGQAALMPNTDGDPANDGRRALAISNAITRLHHEYYGRGANHARTIIQRNYVVTFLDDIYTKVERTLIDTGQHATVKETRLAFQRAMEDKSIAAVEEIMGSKGGRLPVPGPLQPGHLTGDLRPPAGSR